MDLSLPIRIVSSKRSAPILWINSVGEVYVNNRLIAKLLNPTALHKKKLGKIPWESCWGFEILTRTFSFPIESTDYLRKNVILIPLGSHIVVRARTESNISITLNPD